MKKILIISAVLLVNVATTFSQVIKIENGLLIQSMTTNNFDFFSEKIHSYSLMFGIDYLKHSHYELSSELGYLERGGKEKDIAPLESDVNQYQVERWGCIQFNTTFRGKLSTNDAYLYAGIGPKIDVVIGSSHFSSSFLDGYEKHRVILGLRPEVGCNQNVGTRLCIGLNASYLIDFGGVGKSAYTTLISRPFTCSLSLGYRIK